MILLERKRIIIMIVAVFISIFSYLLGSSHMYETVQTVSLPVSGKTVILDAGHGRIRPRGAVTKWGNRSRYELKNYIKSTKIIRTKWMSCYLNTFG